MAIVMETGAKQNAAAAVQHYWNLRKRCYGAQAYNFSDATLFASGQQSPMAMKPDDARAFEQLNVEQRAARKSAPISNSSFHPPPMNNVAGYGFARAG